MEAAAAPAVRRPLGTVRTSTNLVRAERMRRSLAAYIEGGAWGRVEPKTPYTHGRHIDAIGEALTAVANGQTRKLLVNIPPRHMKSLLTAVFWPTWLWLHRPELRMLAASYAHSLAVRDNLRRRQLIQSPWYQERWGHVYQLLPDQAEKSRFSNTSQGLMFATSVGGSATGEGGDLLLLDDPHKLEDAHSAVARERVRDWYKGTWASRLNDPKTGAMVVIMQRIHEDDLSGYLLAEDDGWEHLCLPARYESQHPFRSEDDWRKDEGEPLWPEHVPSEAVDRIAKTMGSQVAAGQLQQRPAPAEGGMLKRAWWQYHQLLVGLLPADVVQGGEWSQLLQSWDMSFVDNDDSSFVVGQVWGKRRDTANCYLLDQVRDHMDMPTTVRAVEALSAKWPGVTLKLIEDKANGPAVVSTLRDSIAGMVSVRPDGSKVARAAAVSPMIESGNVFLPDPATAPWVGDYVEEAAVFPNGVNDDQVDATTQALRRMAGGTIVTQTSPYRR